MKNLLSMILTLILSQSLWSQENTFKKPIIISGAAFTLERGQASQDRFYLGVRFPFADKFHTELNYGYFTRGPIISRHIGTTIGYEVLHSDLGTLYVKSDLVLHLRKNPKTALIAFDTRFFKHSLGIGYGIISFHHIFWNIELNPIGIFYGRNELYETNLGVIEAGDIKAGLGYKF